MNNKEENFSDFCLDFCSRIQPPIRIRRIRMFLGLPDPHPNPLVTGTDPDPALNPSFFS